MIPSSSSTRAATTSNNRSGSVPRIDSSSRAEGSNGAEIRPRNRRLATAEQELVSTSATSTPGGSRAVSPIPQKHPSRRMERMERGGGNSSGRPVGGLLAPPKETGGRSSPVSTGISGIWWGALQELANSVLGGDVVDEEGDRKVEGSTWGKKKAGSGPGRMKLPDAWGPETGLPKKNDGGIGVGSTSERDTKLMQRKRRGVLEGKDEDKQVMDTNGNYKRRTSTEEARPGSSQEDDYALVYIHHVQPQDTLAGVVLKYNCQREVFRKANRFWPNDSIQIRKTVVLPVDACAIKGRPCEPPTPNSPQGVDLLAPTPAFEDPPFSNGITWPGASSSQDGTSPERPEDTEHPWTHVRWVLLDASPNAKPVEIARMPRKTLGYFPPRRRKSQTTLSSVSTPRASAEFSRISQSITQSSNDPSSSTASTPSRRTSNLGPRPQQPMNAIGSYFPPLKPGTRPRRESVSEAAGRLGWFSGPGGVGTFEKNVRKPGPAQDGLNSWARKHVPGLTIDSLPSTSVLGSETAHFGFTDELASIAEGPVNGRAVSGTSTPRGGQGLGLENAAYVLEGWVRKLATKVPGTPKIGGKTEHPDLIELLDGAGSDDGRAFDLSPSVGRSTAPTGTGREDLDGMIRGKTTAGAKGGKND
ncbi:carbohydrate-binding module family 50 protein [Hyaloscypha variabilis]